MGTHGASAQEGLVVLGSDTADNERASLLKSSRMVELCHIDDIPEQRAQGFDPFDQGRVSLFIVKRDSTLYAYRDLCPHYGDTQLPWKTNEYLDRAGEVIVCAGHGARFDIRTGHCISGPCLGQALTAVRLHVSEDGRVLAEMPT